MDASYRINDVNLVNSQVLMTSDENGKYKSSYIYGLNRIAVKTLGITDDKYTPLYYHYDGRGSVTSLVNTADQTQAKYRYDAFGVPKPGLKIDTYENGFINSYGYNGENYDKYTGLQYLRARYYEPETARFLTRDSYLGDIMNPLTLNRYAYTGNNPVMNIDPSGHMSEPYYSKSVGESAGENAGSVIRGIASLRGLNAASTTLKDKINKSLGSANTGCSSSDLQTGWIEDSNGNYNYIYSNGQMAAGWQKLDGNWYYFDESSGKMQTGWINDNGKDYYLYSSGQMATGWQNLDNNWYYFDKSSGKMKTGWKDDSNGNYYYLYSEGQMATGWMQDGNTWYYFNEYNGKMLTNEWVPGKNSNGWYYVGSDGKMLKPHVSYIFYQPGVVSGDRKHSFDEQANIQREKYEEKYHGTEGILLSVSSPTEFKEKWNAMDDNSKTIDAVEIILHGTANDNPDDPYDGGAGFLYFETEDGIPENEYRITAGDNVTRDNNQDIKISDLDSKKMDYLYFSSCNSANPDVKNVGNAFNYIVDANEIVGWDGGTVYVYNDKEPTKSEDVAGGEGGYDQYEYKLIDGVGWRLIPTQTKGQPTWWKYVQKDNFGEPVRERQGKTWIK